MNYSYEGVVPPIGGTLAYPNAYPSAYPTAYQGEDVDHFGKPIPELQGSHVIETDYRLFRYSKFALPWLLFIFACAVVLFCLTLWQGGFAALRTIVAGVPRDLEPWYKNSNANGGLTKPVRNVRFSAAVAAIIGSLMIIIVYYANPRPKIQRIFYYVSAALLIIGVVLGVIAFCIDVSRTRNAQKCKTEPRTLTQTCESRSAYAVVCVVCDAGIALFGLVSAVMVALWTKDETFRNTHVGERSRDLAYDNPFPDEAGVQLAVPGIKSVHQSLVFIGLIALLCTAIMEILFSIFLHEFRERVLGAPWDTVSGQTQTGWPRKSSRLRLSTTIICMGLCLLSFVPYPNRVYVYVLAWLFAGNCVMFFVMFAIDVSDLKKAKNMPCPASVTCTYDEYNATVTFDFITGCWLLIYVVYEFFFKHAQSTVTTQRAILVPTEEMAPENEPTKEAKAGVVEAPHMRPLLGVEVIEVQGPNGELNVTVVNVTPGSAAEEAQLRPGDIIAHWDEMPIHCKADFAQAVSQARIGSTVVLQVIRQVRVAAAASSQVVYCKLTIRGVPA
jgi:membrane-associated protease RseP (regulator of RpoE activity)